MICPQKAMFAVILLQIIMVSPETQLVKNYESQSRPIEFQLKKKQ